MGFSVVQNYPIFWQENLSKDNGLAWYLQGEESQIVTRELVAFCMVHKYFIVPMHDGCLTLERYKTAIIDELKRLLREHTGYAVGVEEKKNISTHKALAPCVFNFASIDTLYEMTDALDDFQRQYESLQKRSSREARRLPFRDCPSKTLGGRKWLGTKKNNDRRQNPDRRPNPDYETFMRSIDWREWRNIKGQKDALVRKFSEPIRYFSQRNQQPKEYERLRPYR